MIPILSALLRLIGDALEGRKSDEDVARELVAAAFASGVPAALLLDHLTALGRDRAELAADIAQWIKTGEKP